jgi:hypothetical protein
MTTNPFVELPLYSGGYVSVRPDDVVSIVRGGFCLIGLRNGEVWHLSITSAEAKHKLGLQQL